MPGAKIALDRKLAEFLLQSWSTDSVPLSHAVKPYELLAIKSSFPSPLKSPALMKFVFLPIWNGLPGASVNLPLPSPKATEILDSEERTAKSGCPSPLKSPVPKFPAAGLNTGPGGEGREPAAPIFQAKILLNARLVPRSSALPSLSRSTAAKYRGRREKPPTLVRNWNVPEKPPVPSPKNTEL